jgi:diadenosine tetraphosphatase ApaH/serine/threonine PP2A family protein phosphatase
MRALVVSDIHGNLQALEAVLAAAGRVDQLWNLGDAVGYGGNPNEVIGALRARAQVNVRGNHDRVCAGLTSSQGFNPVAAQAAMWTQATLTPENLQWLKAVPKGPVTTDVDAICVHGSPIDEDHYILSMRDAWLPLQRMRAPVAFFGHTHMQGAFVQKGADWEEVQAACGAEGRSELVIAEGSRVLVNPGSVGQPRDRDPRASFAVFDSEASVVTFHRVPYDVAGAQAAIRAVGLPERLAQRLESGR